GRLRTGGNDNIRVRRRYHAWLANRARPIQATIQLARANGFIDVLGTRSPTVRRFLRARGRTLAAYSQQRHTTRPLPSAFPSDQPRVADHSRHYYVRDTIARAT